MTEIEEAKDPADEIASMMGGSGEEVQSEDPGDAIDEMLNMWPAGDQEAETSAPVEEPEIDFGNEPMTSVGREALKNAPGNFTGIIKDTFSAIMHPKETAKTMKDLAVGVVKSGTLRIMSDQLGVDYSDLEASSKDNEIAMAESIEDNIN